MHVQKTNSHIITQNPEDTFEKQCNYQAIPFTGITAKGLVKQRGMLMHITSLPAHRSFCGQFCDPQTTEFINWLAKSKQTHCECM